MKNKNEAKGKKNKILCIKTKILKRINSKKN